MTNQENQIYIKLKKLLNNSYAEYSKFKTAAILKTDKGEFCGVNVENSSSGATVCAERNAIFNAITNGSKKFIEINLISNSKLLNIVPCGMCLQVMTEFFKSNTIVNVYNIDGKITRYKFCDLLPYAFTKKELKANR